MTLVFVKQHALVANSMLESKNMDTLVLTTKYFYCFEGNVGNMAVTRKRSHRQWSYMCHYFIQYIFQKIIVYKISPRGWGGGVGVGGGV